LHDGERPADLEVGDTAGLETCATKAGGCCLKKSSLLVTILTDGIAKTIQPLTKLLREELEKL
jgi:hypothetical protein